MSPFSTGRQALCMQLPSRRRRSPCRELVGRGRCGFGSRNDRCGSTIVIKRRSQPVPRRELPRGSDLLDFRMDQIPIRVPRVSFWENLPLVRRFSVLRMETNGAAATSAEIVVPHGWHSPYNPAAKGSDVLQIGVARMVGCLPIQRYALFACIHFLLLAKMPGESYSTATGVSA